MANLRLKWTVIIFFMISLWGVVYDGVSLAQDLARTSEYGASKDGMRIIILASGPVKFNSYWLDNPFRLVIEFQTKNIISKTKEEIAVNQGVIKRISSEYFKEGNSRSLKSLTFELIEKVPYKILQEADTIVLDIQTPADVSVFSGGDKEIFAKNEPKEVMFARLDAMDTALAKVSTNHFLSEALPVVTAESPETRRKTVGLSFWLMAAAMALAKGGQTMALWPIGSRTIALWLIGLASIFGLGGFLFWRRYKLSLDKNAVVQEIENLRFQVAEKNKFLEQEKIIREMVENTSLAREKEIEQLKSEFRKKTKLLEEEIARQAKEEELSKKEIKPEQPENDLESLKEALVDRGSAEEVFSSYEEEKLLTVEKTLEKRQCLRSDLSKDYNRTIILRIESPGRYKSIKSFANNIGLRGLCFETRRDFGEKEAIKLRLFFFGDKVPILKIKAEIIWKKTVFPVNYYGVSFVSMEEEDKTGLSRYIESRITKG